METRQEKKEELKYKPFTLMEMVQKIYERKYLLPSIQRKFVWKEKQITNLFDSLMLGYPIGTILVWEGNSNTKITNKYYECAQNLILEEPFPENKEVNPADVDQCSMVLDGQQRLTSINIALHGYTKKDAVGAKRYLYFNHNEEVETNRKEYHSSCYQFKFLTEDVGKKYQWFKVQDIKEEKDNIEKGIGYDAVQLKNLKRLKEIIYDEQSFFVYTLPEECGIYDILSIFSRLNNSGTPLSNPNLVFSYICSYWKDGGREKIDALLEEVNKKGFRFLVEYVTKVALRATGENVNLKIEKFTPEKVNKIIEAWDAIKQSVLITASLLKEEFCMNKNHVISVNAVVAINYFIYKRLIHKKQKSTKEYFQFNYKNVLDKTEFSEIKKFLVVSMLNGVFGGSTDKVVDSICEVIDSHKITEKFSVEFFKGWSMRDRGVLADKKLIEKFFTFKKGKPETFLALSLLYDGIMVNTTSDHQDHLHPKASFENKNFKTNFGHLSQEKQKEYRYEYDLLANLHLLGEKDNTSKNDTPLKDWLQDKTNLNKVKCLPFIDDALKGKFDKYDLENFDKFIKERKNLMRTEFYKVLGIEK